MKKLITWYEQKQKWVYIIKKFMLITYYLFIIIAGLLLAQAVCPFWEVKPARFCSQAAWVSSSGSTHFWEAFGFYPTSARESPHTCLISSWAKAWCTTTNSVLKKKLLNFVLIDPVNSTRDSQKKMLLLGNPQNALPKQRLSFVLTTGKLLKFQSIFRLVNYNLAK